ncbi:MAG TPA: metal-sensitive transcriptional regulator [Bacteroidota bacterium]|nr:metal-sensitive transcriptional regulator [Bacteroidota bacterium]
MIVEERRKKEFLKRLHYIKGQLEGIERMFGDGRTVKDIFGQLKAVENGLHEAMYGVLDDELKKQFAELLAERLSLCPGDCEDADRLQLLKRQFPTLELSDLVKEYAWLTNSLSVARKPN